MSSREERERLTGELEVRGLIPITGAACSRSAPRPSSSPCRVTRRRRVTAHQAVIILLEQRELGDE